MRDFFAYIRVSTAKQGEKGVSLQEQKDAINRYAARNSYQISEWFEERETAAARGRPIFTHMLRLLRKRKAEGVIIHKIDRSARNLRDWADLGELIDEGVEVHFANEGLDLHSRGGRLSADIQAVVAADYIRNLREETIKGLYGRLKQGIYPFNAPIGYINQGGGKVKTIDPVMGPLVSTAFELYASGKFSMNQLRAEMLKRGLRGSRGGMFSLEGTAKMLRNPFYVGLIKIKRQVFQGTHEPLIPMELFNKVQEVRVGSLKVRITRHEYCFRRFLRCKLCGKTLTGECQKGHIYYRCHTKGCPTKMIREELVHAKALALLKRLQLPSEYLDKIAALVRESKALAEKVREDNRNLLLLRAGHIKDRLNRLTDAYLDHLIDEGAYKERRESALRERQEVEEKLAALNTGDDVATARLERFLMIAGNLARVYTGASDDAKRTLLELLTSNRTLNGRKLDLEPTLPFLMENESQSICSGAPAPLRHHTLEEVTVELLHFFTQRDFVWPMTNTDVQHHTR